MAEIAVTSNGAAVTASVGDQVRLELPENPTTGFRWQLVTFGAGLLRPLGDEYVPSGGTAVGSGGLRVFRFSAASPGAADIRLELNRPWETQPAREEFVARVLVS